MSGDGSAAGPLASPELGVKFFVDDPDAVRVGELIPVFHRWIQEGLIEDELLIDVAIYEHVPKGPGIVLVCDKAHFYFDLRHGRPGMRYRGRRATDVTGDELVARAFRQALHAASLLERDPALEGRYRFRTNEVELGIYDRLRAPSSEETFGVVEPEVRRYVESLYGDGDVTLKLVSGRKEPFLASILTTASPTVEELLERVTAAAS